MSSMTGPGCWRIKAARVMQEQRSDCASFIGGLPILPAGVELPTCRICGAPLTFFFQMEFPPGSIWAGRSMAIFAPSACFHLDHLIPEFVPGELKGARIPPGFLDSYQTFFRIPVFNFKDAVVRTDYARRIKHRPLQIVEAADGRKRFNKIGGTPNWAIEDESPDSYGECKMSFLAQFVESSRYEIEDGASGQMTLDVEDDLLAVPSEERYDELFIDAPFYLFGTTGECEPKLYVVAQKR